MFAQGPRPSIKSSRASSAASDGKRRSKGGKGAKKEEKRDEHLLPNDMHFSSRQLLRLFMKPKFTVSGGWLRA
jgi:condensin complex subunit 2